MNANARFNIRRGICYASVTLWALAAVMLLYLQMSAPPFSSLDSVPADDAQVGAIDIRMEQSRTVFNLAMLAAATLGGLVIAKEGEGKLLLSDWPEMVTAVFVILLVATAGVYHWVFTEQIQAALRLSSVDGSIPDVLSGHAETYLLIQFLSMVFAWLLALLALFSAHNLKGT